MRLLIALLFSANAFAIPHQINYQGHLTAPDGTPLDTTVAMTFSLYIVAVGGAALWIEAIPAVSVQNGLFNVSLGSVTPLNDAVLAYPGTWLGITVGNNAEMTPRSRLSSVAYAYRVGTVDAATGGEIDGTVIIYNGSLGVGLGNDADYLFNLVVGTANEVYGSHSSVTGGSEQRTDSAYAHIGGGQGNRTTGRFAGIAGGTANVAGTSAFVGGGASNFASGNSSAIGGGQNNRARGIRSFIGAGGGDTPVDSNSASGNSAFVGAGRQNRSSGDYAVIAGGYGNISSGQGSMVGGGLTNSATGNESTIAGGIQNEATAPNSFIGGGQGNSVTGTSASLLGGVGNSVNSPGGAVVGGLNNSCDGGNAFVGGGQDNWAYQAWSTVTGGDSNHATGPYSFIGGGSYNVASGWYSTIGGGDGNMASNDYATVPGGFGNEAAGDYSFAAGRNAQAGANGVFAWADGNATIFAPGVANTFNARASGGVRFYTNAGATLGAQLAANATAWSVLCDSTRKERYGRVDTKVVLEKVARIPIETWSYKEDPNHIRHMGPMAQDFYSAFELGESDTTISTLDPDGVALAAIQELAKQNEELREELARQAARYDDLQSLVNQLIQLGHK